MMIPASARFRFRAFATPAALAILGLGLGACDDPTEVEGHAAAEGVAIRSGDAEIYRWMLEDGAPPALSLTVGTHDVTFVLLDHDGAPLPHEEHEPGEEEETLDVIPGDETILTWTAEEHAEGGEPEHLEFHGELAALATGTTTLTLCLAHGEHCDFGTPATAPIAVTVEP